LLLPFITWYVFKYLQILRSWWEPCVHLQMEKMFPFNPFFLKDDLDSDSGTYTQKLQVFINLVKIFGSWMEFNFIE
jgi:hypothetical protein